VWWQIPVTPALRWRQENFEFETGLDYTARPLGGVGEMAAVTRTSNTPGRRSSKGRRPPLGLWIPSS
jgi:hypothetical protein